MAEFNSEGFEELASAFMMQEELATETVNEMLQVEAEIYTEQLKAAAAGYGIRKTGGFINSIKAGKMQIEDTARCIEISPEGKADHKADYGGGYSTKSKKRKGKSQGGNVRYAAIGFIFEYGTSSIQARPWHTQGNAKADSIAYEKAREIWDKYVDSSFS
ncbi:MAG: hypothetical protein EOM40_10085 [Clostridia bacterium]|nr:hypothetical protein [Clostridia bacterium]